MGLNDDSPLYRTSSFCGVSNCVEVAQLPDRTIAIRDTKDRSLGAHVFTAGEWNDFVRGVKNGEFDFFEE